MVRLQQAVNTFSKRIIATFFIASQLFVMLNSINVQKASAADPVATLADSSSSNTSRWISLRDHALYRSNITWPLRSDGCPAHATSSITHKAIPWYPWQPGVVAVAGTLDPAKGDFMSTSGNCATRYQDGGGDAWFRREAFGGWATKGNINLGSQPNRYFNSDKLDQCSAIQRAVGRAAPARIWGGNADDSDHAYGANGLFARGGHSITPDGTGNFLYSHGTTLIRRNFNLTRAQIDLIRSGHYTLTFDGVADDWVKVWINGIDAGYSNGVLTSVKLDFTDNNLRNSLTVGANTIAIQVSDKAVWNTVPNSPPRGAGVCYALNIYGTPPAVSVNCSVTVAPSPVEINQTATARVTVSISGGIPGTAHTFTIAALPRPNVTITPLTRTGVSGVSGGPPVTSDFIVRPSALGVHTLQFSIGNISGYTGTVGCGSVNLEAVRKPFFEAKDGDISSGLSGVCNGWGSTTTGVLKGWNQFDIGGDFRLGAGADLAVFARDVIDQVASGRSGGGAPPKYLTFANNGSNAFGGSFSAPTRCPVDYYETKPDSATSLPGNLIHDLSGSFEAPGRVTLEGGSVSSGNRQVIYVDGDVFVGDDIFLTHDNTRGLAGVSSFWLVVRGNIYIGSSVSRLDGVYVAQPRTDGSGGSIYTCANNFAAPSSVFVANSCQATLRVNGSFIARSLKLYRSGGTMSSGIPAETFNYTPATWLAVPDSIGVRGVYNGYESITSLPPVL